MQAIGGVAVFDMYTPLIPSVYITDPATGAPYVANMTVHPRICCGLQFNVYTATPGLLPVVYSNSFNTYRLCPCFANAALNVNRPG